MRLSGRGIAIVAAAALSAFGGTAALLAATTPVIDAVTVGQDTGSDRHVLTIVGRSLTRFTGFTLADSLGQPVPGDIDLFLRRERIHVLGLPVGLADGEYDLTPSTNSGDGEVIHFRVGEEPVPVGDGGVVFPGTLGSGTVPATGPGVRMMWYPGKAAFRAGRVNGTEWDEGNVGQTSLATGWNTTASGLESTAMGGYTEASGQASTALGAATGASGAASTSMGSLSYAEGDYSTAMGRFTYAAGEASTALGSSTRALGDACTAMGNDTNASLFCSTAMGNGTTASGYCSTSMGISTTASGDGSTATGASTLAGGQFSTATGHATAASGSVSTSMGEFTEASGDYSVAIGYGTIAQSFASLSLGQFNVDSGNDSSWIATDPVLTVGNGTAFTSSNALTLLKSGDLTIAGTLTQNSDARLKKDVSPLASVLRRIASIRGVSYRMKDAAGSAGTRIGLLAQEVREVFPELVHEDTQGNLSVAYGNFSAVLLEAVKEQEAEVAALRKELADVRAATEARIARLEALLEAGTPK